MMIRWCSRTLRFGGFLILVVLLAAAASVGAGATGVVVASGSPFRHTCAPSAVRGYLVEPTATTVSGSGMIVAAWQADRADQGADGIVAATSSDGGRHWATDVVPGLARCEGGKPDAVTDPWLSAGADGTVYLVTDAVTGPRSTIAVSRSLDYGRSWQPPVVLERGREGFSDKPTLTADPYLPGVAFATWNDDDFAHDRRSVMFSRTLDGGRSWSNPRVLAHATIGGPGQRFADEYPEIAALPDGALTLVTTSHLPSRGPIETLEHFARTSTDLGASWSHPTAVDRLTTLPVPFIRNRRLFIRADPGVFSLASGPRGVYLVSALVQSGSRGRLVISRQRPDGTWSHARTIASTNAPTVLPTVAANASGKLAVTWDSIKPVNRGGEVLATVEAAVSDDAGRTWNARRLGQPFVLPRLLFFFFIGDYQALSHTQNGFDAIDITSRRGGRKLHTLVESFTFG